MAEKVNTVKKPARPKKINAKKAVATEEQKNSPTHEEIAQLAYSFWVERGYPHGHAEEDWLRAEREWSINHA